VYTGSCRRAGSLVTGQKNSGHERRSTRTSSVAVTYRDHTWQQSPQGIDATPSIWDPRNQLARAGRAARSVRSDRNPAASGEERRRAGGGRSEPAAGSRFHRLSIEAKLRRGGKGKRLVIENGAETEINDGLVELVRKWRQEHKR
jgi:hypothetical protein